LCHKLLGDARFYVLQMKFDEDLATRARQEGCGECGGRLDSANYPRKPRGARTKVPENYETRFSFCCATEGCRARSTPPSVRFLGRRVYVGAVVVLGSAMQQGVTPVRARRLSEVLGVSQRTLARWREWWKEAFIESAFWKEARAFFSPGVDEKGVPLSLLERFGGGEEERLAGLLRMVRPLSTPGGYVADRRH
jgi:hypothetical protein